MRSLVTMKINNLIVKIFLCIYLVIIITGVVIFENIGFGGGGLEKNIHTASNSETQPVTVKDISSETVSKTTTVNMRDSCSAAPLFDLLTSRFRFSPPFFKS